MKKLKMVSVATLLFTILGSVSFAASPSNKVWTCYGIVQKPGWEAEVILNAPYYNVPTANVIIWPIGSNPTKRGTQQQLYPGLTAYPSDEPGFIKYVARDFEIEINTGSAPEDADSISIPAGQGIFSAKFHEKRIKYFRLGTCFQR